VPECGTEHCGGGDGGRDERQRHDSDAYRYTQPVSTDKLYGHVKTRTSRTSS
jgi:hypothetical protein